jgi:hypothetical protein
MRKNRTGLRQAVWILSLTFLVGSPLDKKLPIPFIHGVVHDPVGLVDFNGKVYACNPQINLLMNRLCTVDTCAKFPQISIYKPDQSEFAMTICNKDLSQVEALKMVHFSWAKSPEINKQVFRCQHLLVDEYQKQTPMWFKLQCSYDLKDLITYLQTSFKTLQVRPSPSNLLMITIEGCNKTLPNVPLSKSFCTVLNKEDVDFLNEHFLLVEDLATMHHMVQVHAAMLQAKVQYNLYPAAVAAKSLLTKFVSWLQENTSIKEVLLVTLFFKVLGVLKEDFRQNLAETVKAISSEQFLKAAVDKVLTAKEGREKVAGCRRSAEKPAPFLGARKSGPPALGHQEGPDTWPKRRGGTHRIG